MISLDELSYTIKREELIINNCDDNKEKFMAFNIVKNLKELFNQLSSISETPEFISMAENFKGDTNDIR